MSRLPSSACGGVRVAAAARAPRGQSGSREGPGPSSPAGGCHKQGQSCEAIRQLPRGEGVARRRTRREIAASVARADNVVNSHEPRRCLCAGCDEMVPALCGPGELPAACALVRVGRVGRPAEVAQMDRAERAKRNACGGCTRGASTPGTTGPEPDGTGAPAPAPRNAPATRKPALTVAGVDLQRVRGVTRFGMAQPDPAAARRVAASPPSPARSGPAGLRWTGQTCTSIRTWVSLGTCP